MDHLPSKPLQFQNAHPDSCASGAAALQIRDQRPCTPESSAVEAATKKLSPKKSKALNQNLGLVVEKETQNTTSEKEDSFVEVIHSRSPVKNSPVKMALFNEVVEDDAAPTSVPSGIKSTLEPTEDSFIDQIITRSPLPAKLIEDSVEAIDALEDAIDQIDAALISPVSPIKIAKTRKSPSKPVAPLRSSPRKVTKNQNTSKVSTKPGMTETQKSTSTRRSTAPLVTSKPPSIRPRLSTKPSTAKLSTTKSSSSTVSPPPLPTTAPKLRPASLYKPPFVPKKSSKAPTKPTFTLPGDAISQKLKEQREARLQAEAAEAAEKKTFRARPVRLSSVTPVVRMTKASRGRVSMSVANSVLEKDDAETRRSSVFKGTLADKEKRISSMSSTKANVGGGGTVIKIPSESIERQSNAPPTASAPKSKKASVKPRTSSLTTHTATASVTPSAAPATTSPSSSEAPKSMSGLAVVPVVSKSKGKEVYARDRERVEALERAKKEKEEAAKKARAEAAERGRKASREWAEKMKAKKAGAVAA